MERRIAANQHRKKRQWNQLRLHYLAITAAALGFCVWIDYPRGTRSPRRNPHNRWMTVRGLRNKVNPDGDEGSERQSHQRDPFNKERSRQQIRKMSQTMKLIPIIMLFTVVAVAGNNPAQDSPLRTLQGTVVDAKGEAVAASIVYLHDEQTHAIRTYVTDPHGRYRFSGIRFYTDYRIHAEHEGLVSAVRRIPAHSTNKLIKLDLKIDRKIPVVSSSVEPGRLSAVATTPNDRPFKDNRLHTPIAVASTL
jgi:hypothetical protein